MLIIGIPALVSFNLFSGTLAGWSYYNIQIMPRLCSKQCSEFRVKDKDICLEGHTGSKLPLHIWHHSLLYSLPTHYLQPHGQPIAPGKHQPSSHLRTFPFAGPSASDELSLLFLSLFWNDRNLNFTWLPPLFLHQVFSQMLLLFFPLAGSLYPLISIA